MIRRCDLVPQYKALEKGIDQAIKRVLSSGRYTLAEEVAAFENEFARYNGSKHAVSVANATDGLTLSLMALGIGRGDEVITTVFTAIPTVSAIVDSGATPVFVDIDPDTFLMDLSLLRRAITRKTKAVIPVHIFGNVVDIRAVKKICGKIPIIEDAAQAHGSALHGRKAGSWGDLGVFSFYPTKNLGAYGDGGLVVTDRKDLFERLKLIRMYGMTDKDHIAVHGVNSRLDELQAAILRVKLKRLDAMNATRNRIAKRYREELRGNLFAHQLIPAGAYANYHVFVSRFTGNRGRFIKYMDAQGIQTNIYYALPLHLQKANRPLGYGRGDFPMAEEVCRQVIALPLYPELEHKVVTRIIRTINKF